MSDAGKRTTGDVATFLIALFMAVSTAQPAHAQYTLLPPADLTLVVRSSLAEAGGESESAIAWAESLATLEPRSAFAAARVATLHEDMGQDYEALQWGERALACDSLNVDAAMLVGRMRLRAGECQGAVQVLTPPLRQLGAPPELYGLRALAHELSRSYDAALADLKRTDVLLPDFAWIATGILGLSLEDGRLEEANQALQLALELRPEDSRVLSLGVRLAQRTGDKVLEETLLRSLALLPEARTAEIAGYGAFLFEHGKEVEFRQLVRWADSRGIKESELRIEAGRQLFVSGSNRDAIEIVKPAANDSRAIALRARASVSLGDEKGALAEYRRLLSRTGVSREESLVVAYLEIRKGDRSRGVYLLESARMGGLDTPRQVLAASLCYALIGHPDESVALIRESASRGIASPPLYQELGSAASAIGDNLLAQWAFERLRDLGGETSECLTFLAATDLSRGKSDRAATQLERAIQLNPKNGKALLMLGRIRHQKGQLESARDLLRQAAACPEASLDANTILADVCRSLRLDTEAKEAAARAKAIRVRAPVPGLSLSPETPDSPAEPGR
ncbi:MAG TPA: tetratricopeptide repeat protein [Candidatus Eisenbacteria bacterium]|nr:tetratricopeptide repeat protein [Candidatus Eisenbacteria bacterium]